MRFKKGDLLETVDMLNDGLGLGDAQVLYAEKKGFYGVSDFELVRSFEKEILGADHGAGRMSVDAWDFFDTLKRISLRKDLGEEVDVVKMAERMEREIVGVFSELRSIGLYEPFLEKQIRDLVKFGDGPERPVYRDFGQGKVGFLPNVNYFGRTELTGYALMVPILANVHELLYFPKELPLSLVGNKMDSVEELRMWSERYVSDVEFKNKDMNRNSLENFRNEAAMLKIPVEMVSAAEKLMEKGVEKIELRGQLEADKGQMDLTVFMKKSGQSDYYYLNKFEVAQSKAAPLEKDHQYIVISPDPAKEGSNLVRRFDSAVAAMDYFRDQKGTSELSIGKFDRDNVLFKDTVATMKLGKVDYVKDDFRVAYYSPILRNSHYVDRGKGFSVEQAANMLQGRAVFRSDMVSRAGEAYKAWSQYQFDQPKDRFGNYTMKQFGEGYGFELKKELSAYEIKELGAKDGLNKLVDALQNGNRPLVTVGLPDGGEKRLMVEAVPRYTNLNFFETNGRPVKREELKKDLAVDMAVGQEKGKAKGKDKAQENELSL